MEHYYNISSIVDLNPKYKKKVTVKYDTPVVYTVVSVDLPFSSSQNIKKETTEFYENILQQDECYDEPHIDESSIDDLKRNNDDDDDGHTDEIHNTKINGFLFRSVILNENENSLLSFSLPKSIPIEEFKEKYNVLDTKRFIITEIIEGTMINLWWDSIINRWQISTKKSISGNYTYFRNPFTTKTKTFKEMFIDVVGDFESEDFEKISNIDRKYFYSFVLKHPENHIVHSVIHPIVYLVAVYEKTHDWEVKYIPQTTFMKWCILQNINIKYPKFLTEDTVDDMTYDSVYVSIEDQNKNTKHALMNSIFNEDVNYTMGFMIVDTENGTRTKIENYIYKYLKQLRGNHPSYKYKFYELIKSNRIQEFIYYFPQYIHLFMNFNQELNTFVNTIHWYYVNKFILKNPQFLNGNIPYQYSYHVNHIHYNIYLPSLNSSVIKITLYVVYEYMCSLSIKNILYWLNPINFLNK